GLTMVYVTHDQKEALALAGRLAVMSRGRIAQLGAPAEVYERPASRFVANFLGDSNFLPGTVRADPGGEGRGVEAPVGQRAAAAPGPAGAGAAVVCSIRPQALTLAPPGADGLPNRIAATVETVAFLGDVLQVRLNAAGPAPTAVRLPDQGAAAAPSRSAG